MKIVAPLVLAALVLVGASCGPHRRHHDGPPCDKGAPHGWMRGCGPDACNYDRGCFSNGAIRSNGGACQECSAGKWVSASGCAPSDCCMGGMGGMGKGPCPQGRRGKK